MYDALDAEKGAGSAMTKMYDETTGGSEKPPKDDVPFEKPTLASAVLSPSSVIHRSSPQIQVRQANPTSIETDKDTQKLVEEDKSEC